MKKLFLLTCFAISYFLLYRCSNNPPTTKINYEYVGSDKCESCHKSEFKDHHESDHFHAMDSANSHSVRGDFNNSIFVYYKDTTRFYKKDDSYFILTTDSNGTRKEFRILYTLGWFPLQQYMTEFSDGKIQVLPFCWDTRTKEDGGQRWFHIYGKEKILPGDELFWTGINQNWNNMCADCHTTNLKKNFDFEKNSFHTSWSVSNVSCESCHGPASNHLDFVERKTADDSLKGFQFNIHDDHATWAINSATGNAVRSVERKTDRQFETCARCHVRATRLTDDYIHGKSLLQTHLPSLIDENYFPDGQIKEEDYEYGSFLQSKMHMKGVTCTNCHDPHTLKLKALGNNVCYSCHSEQKYFSTDHTHHDISADGSKCVNCHMPVHTYMVIDNRLDHSIRIPRPDLSLKNNTPNACNQCHKDKSVQWATMNFEKWYGRIMETKPAHFSEYLPKIVDEKEGAYKSFQLVGGNESFPAIVRSTALTHAMNYYSKETIAIIRNSLNDPDPMIRLSAVSGSEFLPADTVTNMLVPLLSDPILSVRIESARILSFYMDKIEPVRKEQFDKVIEEYLKVQKNMGDRPEGYLNSGIVYTNLGKLNDAEKIYQLGLSRFPKFIGLYINMADFYRMQNLDNKGEDILETALKIDSGNAHVWYSLALLHIRNKEKEKGMNELTKAFGLSPTDGTIAVAYAIALNSFGKKDQAVKILENFVLYQHTDKNVLLTLIQLLQENKQDELAEKYLTIGKKIYE